MPSTTLSHLRVAILAADGVEEETLRQPLLALRDAGAKVDLLSLRAGEIQALRGIQLASRFGVERVLEPGASQDYDALVLPGGALSADALRVDRRALAFVQEMQNAGRSIAALGHSAWILISAGLVNGRILTSAPGAADDLRNAGANYVDQEVVVQRSWVSSRGPRDLPAFNREIVKLFSRTTPSVIRIAESA